MKPRLQYISLSQLNEPEIAARTEMTDGGLDSLAASIRAVGVLEPLGVFAVDGGRFEIVYGHRRFHASQKAGLVEVPCLVYRDRATAEAMKLHENLEREELSPADEGVFFHQLYRQHGEDVMHVAELVKKSPEYVERRMLLIRGDERVLEALRAGLIAVTVAEQFNRLKRPQDIAFYLDHAIRSGCTVRQARQWVETANYQAGLNAAAGTPAPNGAPADGAAPAPVPPGTAYLGAAHPHEITSSRELARCLFCQEIHEQWKCIRKFVCRGCADANLAMMTQEPITGADQARYAESL